MLRLAGRPSQLPTISDLQPLYQAIWHGCLSGRHSEALDKVYRERILRGTRNGGYYSTKQLGAIGANLAAMAAFFEHPWIEVSGNLGFDNQDWVLSEAGLYLRSLGRLAESLDPMRVAMERRISKGDWENSATLAHNLSELEVMLGNLDTARQHGRNAIVLADRSNTHFERMNTRAIAADALFQAGETRKAKYLFESSEGLQAEHDPKQGQLYSIGGFHYCNFIMAPVELAAWQQTCCRSVQPRGPASRQKPPNLRSYGTEEAGNAMHRLLGEIEGRAMRTLDWPSTRQDLLSSALDRLTLARVEVYRVALFAETPSACTVSYPDASLRQVREAGDVTFVPVALLTVAYWHALHGDHAVAQRYLSETQQIAERGPMPLHLADVHLHRARLFRDRDELAKAKALIEKHGYWRRREELADAETASVAW